MVGSPPTASGVSADRYWEEDGIRTGGTIVKFYNHYLGGTVPFVPDGTVIASFPVSQLSSAGQARQYGGVARPNLTTLPSYTPPGGGSPIMWGASLLRTGNTVYIYGTQSPKLSDPGHVLYLARVPVSRLTTFSAWRFYAGAGTWSAVPSAARPVQPGADASSGFSVIKAGGRYWLIQAATAQVAPDIDAYPARTPWGPFDFTAGRLLYRDPAIGLDAAHDYRILYEARATPALSTRNSLVISYNVNSEAVTTGCAPMSAFTNTLTLPRFVSVPMSAFGAAARARRRSGEERTGPLSADRAAEPIAVVRRLELLRRLPAGARAGVGASPAGRRKGHLEVARRRPPPPLSRLPARARRTRRCAGENHPENRRHHHRTAVRQLPRQGGASQLQEADRACRPGNLHRPLIRAGARRGGGCCYRPGNRARRRNILVRLIIAVAVGLAIAIGGTVLVVNVVSGHSDKPTTSSQYNSALADPGRPGRRSPASVHSPDHRSFAASRLAALA